MNCPRTLNFKPQSLWFRLHSWILYLTPHAAIPRNLTSKLPRQQPIQLPQKLLAQRLGVQDALLQSRCFVAGKQVDALVAAVDLFEQIAHAGEGALGVVAVFHFNG